MFSQIGERGRALKRLPILLALTLAASTLAMTRPQIAGRGANEALGEWRGYAGSNAGLKYSPLDQINKANVKNLRITWRQSAMPTEVRQGRKSVVVPTNYQVTPLMANGLLYVSAGDGSIAALNPANGGVVWSHVPPELLRGAPAGKDEPAEEMLAGRSANRGVAYWSGENNGKETARIIALAGRSLIALNATTGALVADFGSGGTVDVTKGYRRPAASMRWTSVPVVVNDVIVIGGVPTAPDGNFMPGDIRGFDVRSGKLVWTFNVIPGSAIRKRYVAEGLLRVFRRRRCLGADRCRRRV
jgi:quinoprotein glucose dehydrogenase